MISKVSSMIGASMGKDKSRNIDDFLDSLISVQSKNGVETNLKKALFDPYTHRRINKFERERMEQKGVDLSEYGDSKKKDKPMEETYLSRGIFVFSEADLISDDDFYICEYCHSIGRDNKYRPEVCDVCQSCEDCREMASGECDGCSYSPFYNGTTYSEVNSEANEVDYSETNDAKILEGSWDDSKPRRPDGGFSVLRYGN